MRYILIYLACILYSGLFITGFMHAHPLSISSEQTQVIGKKIWQNECKGTMQGLTSWNIGEEFPSLGIGHFIWYPRGYKGPFTEQFPLLVHFLMDQGVKVPEWLRTTPECPWLSRQEFLNDFDNPKLTELRTLLANTVELQTRFIIQRLHDALPKMLRCVNSKKQDHIKQQFYRIAQNPEGYYVLIDYINFKGEGINPTERYKGQGWGLVQVLERMQGKQADTQALIEFSKAAKAILEQRVNNAPTERNEQRWLPGWYKRIETYIPS